MYNSQQKGMLHGFISSAVHVWSRLLRLSIGCERCTAQPPRWMPASHLCKADMIDAVAEGLFVEHADRSSFYERGGTIEKDHDMKQCMFASYRCF